jgi:hypothetical protein
MHRFMQRKLHKKKEARACAPFFFLSRLKKVFTMMQTKEEYQRVRDIIAPRRCGKYRYLRREKRIRKFEKWINQNRADARLSSFTHNFCRFTSIKVKSNIEAHEARAYSRKLAYFEKRARCKLANIGIHLFTQGNITISAEEEKEISFLLARLTNSYSFNAENSKRAPCAPASVRLERKNE